MASRPLEATATTSCPAAWRSRSTASRHIGWSSTITLTMSASLVLGTDIAPAPMREWTLVLAHRDLVDGARDQPRPAHLDLGLDADGGPRDRPREPRTVVAVDP